MDWDRRQHTRRALTDEDDGNRFVVTGLDAINTTVKRVALCVSASYDVLEADVQMVESDVPIIKADLVGRNTHSHWSESKQQHLAQQFLDIVMSLAQQGIVEISLFLAAPRVSRCDWVLSTTNVISLVSKLTNMKQVTPSDFPGGSNARSRFAPCRVDATINSMDLRRML